MTSTNIKSDLETNNFSFAKHETFYLRDGWIYKGLQALQTDGSALYHTDAHHNLGIGINMLKSLIYWLRATNLVEMRGVKGQGKPTLELTPLSSLILQVDPYFEDIVTLWLLHIGLSSNRSLATFIYWAFNECSQREFTEERLVREIRQFIDENEAKQVAQSSLEKDARCFIHTYLSSDYGQNTNTLDNIECPLTSLDLIRRGAIPGHYRLNVGEHRKLPLGVFIYALFRFRDLADQGGVISLEDIRWAPCSPGRILNIDMHTILEYIEEIEHTSTHLHLTRTADLNMVTLDNSIETETLLRGCYKRRESND